MTSTTTSLNCYNFAGIRTREAKFSDEAITCSDCQNVELYYTGLTNMNGASVGLKTAKGNTERPTNIGENEIIYGMFEASFNGTKYIVIYTEDDEKGYLYYGRDFNILTKCEQEFIKTQKACGTNYTQGWSDIFVFTNGKNILYIDYNIDTNEFSIEFGGVDVESEVVYTKTAYNNETGIYDVNIDVFDLDEVTSITDWVSSKSPNRTFECYSGNDNNNKPYLYTKTYKSPVLFTSENDEVFTSFQNTLGCVSFDGRIWLFRGNMLFYSKQQDCGDFGFQNNLMTDAGYIYMPKPITAIANYLGSLAVFFEDSSTLVTVGNGESVTYSVMDDSPGGCASYNTLIFHGTELYFYDKTKNSMFSFNQVVNGDKTLSDNIAVDVMDVLGDIDNIENVKTMSVIQGDRNEMWFLIKTDEEYSTILIFDYLRKEFLKRVEQQINAFCMFNGQIYSGSNKVFKEYETNTFDGEYIEAYYDCSILNLGTDNTLKITKGSPKLAIDGNYDCYFEVKYTKNYDKSKKPKRKIFDVKTQSSMAKFGFAIFGQAKFPVHKPNKTLKLPTATFRALEIMFSNKDVKGKPKEFAFKGLEIDRLKVKQL